MKLCEYCESEVADDILQCNSCGAKEFKNICINCGTKFSGIKCPTCSIMVGDKPKVCFNCGKKTFSKICPACKSDLVQRRKVQVNFHEIYKDGGYEAYHYVMKINDDGKAVNKSGERYFEEKFAFKILHRKDNDWIATIKYSSYQGNHDKFKPEAYDVEGWDVDIYEYK